MLFASPIVKEQVRLDSRFSGLETITDENVATVALERRGQRDLELMRLVNSMLKDAGNEFIALRLYNGSGERLWLDTQSFNGASGIWKYPPDLFIDPGQWSVVIAKTWTAKKTNARIANLTLSYTGEQSDVTANWAFTNAAKVSLYHKPGQPAGAESSSVAKGDRVAILQRGYVGDNLVMDGIYTTLHQFPYPTSKV